MSVELLHRDGVPERQSITRKPDDIGKEKPLIQVRFSEIMKLQMITYSGLPSLPRRL
ncbi:MAG TPA: hypothetical protein PK667_04465 [Nitrosomonas europaea]|uniref:hypothetical protein n=1 Tax=Nitrosomonas europaea TaxID=915 RepID=UPI002CBE5D0C|nr:hypothetical protein [Nitrosomonas europaea]HRN82461.1 hypothetical protein [Nitrosomonas europaea]HRO55495.1 hypothetical protein [Nitrosomonas europaea]HUM73440.1 hypothetical protein [Nitrosomonas europaea]